MPAIVLCADDFGLTGPVSEAILDLIDRGRLTATSAMTNLPAWESHARHLVALSHKAALGVHLNLTAGPPLAPMPRFAPTGDLPAFGAVASAALTCRLPLDEIEAEIGRQIDAFEDAVGRVPDFLDGHRHVHVLPGIRAALFRALERRGLAGRLWLRDPADRLGRILARRRNAGKALVVAVLAAGFGREARRRGFSTNDGFSGFSAFGGIPFATEMASFLESIGPRHLVMCHPGVPDEALARLDAVTTRRYEEYDHLISDSFQTTLSHKSVRLQKTWPIQPDFTVH